MESIAARFFLITCFNCLTLAIALQADLPVLYHRSRLYIYDRSIDIQDYNGNSKSHFNTKDKPSSKLKRRPLPLRHFKQLFSTLQQQNDNLYPQEGSVKTKNNRKIKSPAEYVPYGYHIIKRHVQFRLLKRNEQADIFHRVPCSHEYSNYCLNEGKCYNLDIKDDATIFCQ